MGFVIKILKKRKMKYLLGITLSLLLTLSSCDSNDGPYKSPLPGLWIIEKVHGPHADDIRGGYMEFSEDGKFTWSSKRTVVEGTYEDIEEYFQVQYKGYEIKKKFDYKIQGEYLVVVPEISGQKFFLKRMD
jgi:hypothetical protein